MNSPGRHRGATSTPPHRETGGAGSFQRRFRAEIVTEVDVQNIDAGWLTFGWTIARSADTLHGFDVAHLSTDGQLDVVAGFFFGR